MVEVTAILRLQPVEYLDRLCCLHNLDKELEKERTGTYSLRAGLCPVWCCIEADPAGDRLHWNPYVRLCARSR